MEDMELFSKLFKSFNYLVFITDVSDDIIYTNDLFAKKILDKLQKVSGKKVSSLFDFEESLYPQYEFISTLKINKSSFGWNMQKIENGSKLYCVYIGIELTDLSENDITRQEIKRSEEQYRMIVEDQTELICRWKADGKIIFANDTYAYYFGIPRNELIGKNFFNLISDEEHTALLQAIKADTIISIHECRIIIGDEKHWLSWTNRKKFNERQEIVEIQSVGHDITDRKIIENRLWQKNNEMESLFKAFPDLFFRLDKNGSIIDFAGDESLLSISPVDFIDSPVETILPEDMAFGFDEIYKNIGDNSVLSLEYYNQMSDNWQEIRFIKLFDDQTGMILRDISKRKHAEIELQKAKDSLEEKVSERTAELVKTVEKLEIQITERIKAEEEKKQIKDQFIQAQKMESLGVLAGGIAHDFNNLMNVINGYSQMLLWELNEKDPQYEDLREIQEAAVRASRLTHQLLIFSRQSKSEKAPMNLNVLLDGILKMTQRIIGEDIVIRYLPGKDLLDINADQGNIEQILMNLLINSRDAMPQGGEIVLKTNNADIRNEYTHYSGTVKPGKYVCIEIEDNGSGMDARTTERAFEPFFTTKGQGKGTGLGLSVVYGIVKDHDGWIELTSELNKGTTFKIFFPVYEGKAAKVVVCDQITVNYQGNGENILLIEDETALLKINARALTEHGYNVITASNAKDAEKEFIINNGNLNLIFCDVVLPDKSGIDLVEEFLAENPDIHVLLTSGYTAERSRLEDIQKQNIRFIQKPYKLSEMFKIVYEAINNE